MSKDSEYGRGGGSQYYWPWMLVSGHVLVAEPYQFGFGAESAFQ